MTQKVTYITVDTPQIDQRLDNYLIRLLKGVPKSHIYRIIRSGEVRVNKKRALAETRLHTGDYLRLPPVERTIRLEKRPPLQDDAWLKGMILYEDEACIVLNKPAGLAVHGGSGVSFGAIELLRFNKEAPHLELVHRLDKETSGCLLIAKKRSFLKAVHQLLREQQVQKTYVAILHGHWTGLKTRIVDLALEKKIQGNERRVTVNAQGKASRTAFLLIQNFKTHCLVEVKPSTGRTHQIRVHAQAIGHPVLGDDKYGDHYANNRVQQKGHRRLFLHAKSIQFKVPGQQAYCFEAPLDPAFTHFLKSYENS